MLQSEIVEYLPIHAAAVASMWNRSSEGWNGRVFNKSEAKVQQEESATAYLNLYLAMKGDLVIGYAKLTKYFLENGVAYIELLSVDPAYHGQGIGRELVQKCVLRAAELGYERIDLFTWAGNTKAVPLYKKCGYFWEKMESNSTHLMNFIPGLLNNDLLKPYFEYFHWYEDSVRPLETKPDGRDVNGYDLYDYVWEKEGKRLEISFERCGRGIVSIRTPDFAVSHQIAVAKPVFGLMYPVAYHLENLGDNPLEISLKGLDNDIIQHSFSKQQSLCGTLDCQGEFYIGALKRDLNEWESCPSVITKLLLDGKEITLKTGLNVQYPLSANIRSKSSLMIPGREEIMYLNVQNHFQESCEYDIELPEDSKLKFTQRTCHISLQGGEKANILFSFSASGACIYSPQVLIKANLANGKSLEFTTECCDSIRVIGDKAGKQLNDNVQLINSQYYLYFTKTGSKNYCNFGSIYGENFNISQPQLGLPYTDEFEREEAYDFAIEDHGQDLCLCAKFRSREIPELDFAVQYRLTGSGQMDLSVKILALPERAEDIFAKLKISLKTSGLAFETKGKVLQFEDDLLDAEISDLPMQIIEGNWLFSKSDDSTAGVIWPKQMKAYNDHYQLAWDINLSELARKGQTESEVISFYLDVFKNPWQIRNVAIGRSPIIPKVPSLELLVNEGNPWITGSYNASLIQHLDKNMTGRFQLEASSGVEIEARHITDAEEIKAINWQQIAQPANALELLSCQAKFSSVTLVRKQLLFQSGGKVIYSSAPNMLSAANACLEMCVATDAKLPGLISLKYNGDEWLDNAYPEFAPKSFFNPYSGGLGIKPSQIGAAALAEETHTAEKACLADQHGNLWEGLSILSRIDKFKPLKGLAYRQYYLMRPGVPVLATLIEILGNPGWAQFYQFRMQLCQIHQQGSTDAVIYIPKPGEQWQKVNSCNEQVYAGEYYPQFAVQKAETELRLQLFSKAKLSYNTYMDSAVISHSAYIYSEMVDVVPAWTAPVFMVLAKDLYQAEWLSSLLATIFEPL